MPAEKPSDWNLDAQAKHIADRYASPGTDEMLEHDIRQLVAEAMRRVAVGVFANPKRTDEPQLAPIPKKKPMMI